jgi:Zn-finger nucleic acid-binding protein
MICPKCNTGLNLTITQGIEIDFCPNCRGVWLDKGELEKIIERSNQPATPYSGGPGTFGHHDNHHEGHHDKHHDSQYGYGQRPKHKRGFLGDLFDF